jgi:hypothetical protein
MQGKSAYIKPKVVRPFPGPYASRSYVHRAALFSYLVKSILDVTRFRQFYTDALAELCMFISWFMLHCH